MSPIEKIISPTFTAFFEEHGFKKLRPDLFGRITDDGIFQFVTFENARRELLSFSISFSCNLLFVKKMPEVLKVFKLKPGASFDVLINDYSKEHRWFRCDDAKQIESNVNFVKSEMDKKLFKWFDYYSTNQHIVELYSDNEFCPPDIRWWNFDLMFIHLFLKEYNKAKEKAEFLIAKESSFPFIREVCQDVLTKLRNNEDIKEYLNSIIVENIRELKLQKM